MIDFGSHIIMYLKTKIYVYTSDLKIKCILYQT